MLKEFKKFISRGNVIDLAVGVIIGKAFGDIVTSLVNDVIMPVIGLLLGGINFEEAKIILNKTTGASLNYGLFVQNIVNFLIISFCIFIMVKCINKITHKEPPKKEAPKKSDDVILLEEIRDLLKEKNKKTT